MATRNAKPLSGGILSVLQSIDRDGEDASIGRLNLALWHARQRGYVAKNKKALTAKGRKALETALAAPAS